MSFKLFGIEFDGKKDCNSIGEKKMDEVCRIVGTKLIKTHNTLLFKRLSTSFLSNLTFFPTFE